jgi:putative ABC transport system substrate-binding protein
VRRREFIAGLGGTATAWPLAARAQQPAIPVIGFLYAASGLASENRLAALRQGLAETGYIEGQNVSILKAGADGKFDRLPALAAELVRREVNVIAVPQSSVAATAAHNATKLIPIVFSVTVDPSPWVWSRVSPGPAATPRASTASAPS